MGIEQTPKKWRKKLHEVIYEADTKAGKIFDVVLLILIIVSILLVMLESVEDIDQKYHEQLYIAEWIVTILFTIEYFLRVISIKKSFKYIFSFYGVIDLLSTIPMYLSVFFAGTHTLVALRGLRLLRIFRILKLTRYIGESNELVKALKASKAKILVFLSFVLILCIILGSVIYIVEDPEDGFTSIPRSIYWAIITLTTVGYGDITPKTGLGQFIASAVMILGYAIIAIPTGIVSSEITKAHTKVNTNTQSCHNCSHDQHDDNAVFCNHCGAELNINENK